MIDKNKARDNFSVKIKDGQQHKRRWVGIQKFTVYQAPLLDNQGTMLAQTIHLPYALII